jgi:hypothetical protein
VISGKYKKVLEARVGIEPTRKGFADLSLTTWVPRLTGKTLAQGEGERKFWSGRRGSNPRLRPWQGRTLPLSYSRSAALIITKRLITSKYGAPRSIGATEKLSDQRGENSSYPSMRGAYVFRKLNVHDEVSAHRTIAMGIIPQSGNFPQQQRDKSFHRP